MYTIVLTLVTLIISAVYIFKKSHLNRYRRYLPGPWGLPFIGYAHKIKPDRIYEQFDQLAQLYGKIFQLKLFGSNVIVLNSVDIVNKAFVTNGHLFNERSHLFIADRIGLMKSVSFTKLKDHNVVRKAFVKSLRLYGSGLSKFESIVQDELKRVVQKIEYYDGKEFEVIGLIRRSIVNVISILMIGEEASDENVELFFELTAGEDFFLNAGTNTILSNVPLLLHLPYYKRRLQTIVGAKRILQNKYVLDVKSGAVDTEKNGFVNGLFQCQQKVNGEESALTDDMIKAICVSDVLSAGILTTSATLANSILCLINHPEYQTKIQKEINTVFGSVNHPSLKERHECSLTQAVLLETLRYIPTTPFLLPHSCLVDTELDGYHIKADSQILANLWSIHHDATIWGDPWTFRPERFLDDDGNILSNDHTLMKSPDRFSFLAFGAGRRKCPGMTMATTRLFLYLTTLLQKFTLLPSAGKCGTCDPRYGDFEFGLLVKPREFYCIARTRDDEKI